MCLSTVWVKEDSLPKVCYNKEGIKPDPKKFQGIMYLGQPDTTTEAQALIGMIQYNRYMRPRRSHVLAPLTEADNIPKSRKILWNDDLEICFKELKRMISAETLLIYPD